MMFAVNISLAIKKQTFSRGGFDAKKHALQIIIVIAKAIAVLAK